MEFEACVRRDRATRAFRDEPVSEEIIEGVLDVARQAGSGKNRQPWSFVVVRDRDRLDTLASFGRYTTPLERAPVGIVLLVTNRGDGQPRPQDVLDCGRALQNLSLAVTDVGLGSVPQAVDANDAAALLEVPNEKTVLLILAVGYPDEADDTIEGEPKEAVLESMDRQPLSELVHWETHR